MALLACYMCYITVICLYKLPSKQLECFAHFHIKSKPKLLHLICFLLSLFKKQDDKHLGVVCLVQSLQTTPEWE